MKRRIQYPGHVEGIVIPAAAPEVLGADQWQSEALVARRRVFADPTGSEAIFVAAVVALDVFADQNPAENPYREHKRYDLKGVDGHDVDAVVAPDIFADQNPAENPFREPKRYDLNGVDGIDVDVAPAVTWVLDATSTNTALRVNRSLFEHYAELGIVPPVPLGEFSYENTPQMQYSRGPYVFPSGAERGNELVVVGDPFAAKWSQTQSLPQKWHRKEVLPQKWAKTVSIEHES